MSLVVLEEGEYESVGYGRLIVDIEQIPTHGDTVLLKRDDGGFDIVVHYDDEPVPLDLVYGVVIGLFGSKHIGNETLKKIEKEMK